MSINEIFDLLDDWRCLPSYQLERRSDIFFAIHLKKIIKELYQIDIDLIIPEFPVRKGSLKKDPVFNNKSAKNYKSNQSFKIDYLAYSSDKNIAYFIELKTDMDSLNPKQNWYLNNAVKLGFVETLEDLKGILKASNSKGKVKYKYLIKKLINEGLLDGDFKSLKLNVSLKKVYIQPSLLDSQESSKYIITYDKIREVLSDSKDPLTIRFIESLAKWKTNCDK